MAGDRGAAQADAPKAEAAVHHLHAAAGRGESAQALAFARHVAGAAALRGRRSRRRAGRPHHVHAHRFVDAVGAGARRGGGLHPRRVRRRVQRRTAPLPHQRAGGAGGPRGHQAHEHGAHAGQPRALPRPADARALPSHLVAHARQPDDRRATRQDQRVPRLHLRRGGARLARQRLHRHLPRLPAGVWRPRARQPAARPARGPAHSRSRRRGIRRRRRRPGRGRGARAPARDLAAGPVYRGVAGAQARGGGHRSAVHVRLDRDHHPEPRLRREEEQCVAAHLRRHGRHPSAARPLPAVRRPAVHRGHGGRPRRHRPGREGLARVPGALLSGRGWRPGPGAAHRRRARSHRVPDDPRR